MKSVLFALVFAITSSAFASTVDSRSVVFDGSFADTVLNLKAEKTHTEYRYEQVARTCYRTVLAGHRQVCRRPSPNQPGRCWSEPIYRTVPYTCYETVTIPYEVFDYYVDANVAINFGALPEGMSARENITATLNGEVLTLRSTGTKTLILELESINQNRNMNGNTLMLDAVASVKFHAAAPVLAALNMKNVSIKKNVMTYTLGPVAGLQLGHNLKILDNPVLGGSTTLFDGEMGAALSQTSRGNVTDMRIAFADVLGRELGGGRFSVTAKTFFKAGAGVLNSAELGDLSVEKTILYKR